MALHLTRAEHDADPPSGWTVHKHGRRWQLRNRNGGVLDTFDTKAKAEAAKVTGFLVTLYQNEGRWFNGETVPGWKPYVEPQATPGPWIVAPDPDLPGAWRVLHGPTRQGVAWRIYSRADADLIAAAAPPARVPDATASVARQPG
jgi:hypothetical protein